VEKIILNWIISYLKNRGFFFKIERKKDHPIYKDNFVKYYLYQYTEDGVEY
jgi:hypothetical protein